MDNPFVNNSMTEPETIVIGNYVTWRKIMDFSLTGLSVNYELRPIAGSVSPIVVSGSVVDQTVTFTINNAISSTLTVGDWRWDLIITRDSDSEKTIVDCGYFTVTSGTVDQRSHARIMLKKIESILEGRADSDVSSYTIRGRSITKMGVEELLQWRDYYKSEIVRQSKGPRQNQAVVRFGL